MEFEIIQAVIKCFLIFAQFQQLPGYGDLFVGGRVFPTQTNIDVLHQIEAFPHGIRTAVARAVIALENDDVNVLEGQFFASVIIIDADCNFRITGPLWMQMILASQDNSCAIVYG